MKWKRFVEYMKYFFSNYFKLKLKRLELQHNKKIYVVVTLGRKGERMFVSKTRDGAEQLCRAWVMDRHPGHHFVSAKYVPSLWDNDVQVYKVTILVDAVHLPYTFLIEEHDAPK